MKPWGCPAGHPESFVRDTARDEDGYVVRHRQCTTCQAFWTTQEVPLAPEAYWTRAYSRNQARLALAHRELRTCTYCGAQYRAGNYRRHIGTSRQHEAALMRKDRDRRHARDYARTWARRRAKIA
jgi:hypothetical protein